VQAHIHFTDTDIRRTRLVPGLAPFYEAVYGVCRLVNNYPDPYFRPWVGSTRERLAPGLRPALSILYSPAAQDSDIAAAAYQMSVEHAVDTLKSLPRRQISTAVENRPRPRTGSNTCLLQPPPTTSPEPVGAVLADAFQRYYDSALAPHWAHLRRLADDAHARHCATAAEYGIDRLLATLDPRIRWAARTLSYQVIPVGGDADINVDLAGRGIVLVPSVFIGRPAGLWIQGADHDVPLVLSYPVPLDIRATPWRDPTTLDGGHRLAALLGATRAALLTTLDTDQLSTTQLAARLGISAASASEHATILRSNGLTLRTRDGNRVIHSLTDLGRDLIHQPDRQ
jgi:biotin operon repressor